MSTTHYPFLIGLDGIHLQEHSMLDRAGELSTVQLETARTPYRNFVLLFLQPGLMRLPKRRIIVASTSPPG